tara:strand:- start:304 stop:1101 length:798 start_codon:yes stop_codon:yes gene_type:complete
MSYKLCDTCNKVELKGLNLFSENNEEWNNFPHPLPILGKREGSQNIEIDMGKVNSNCLIYWWGTQSMFQNLNLEYPDSYINSMNNGLMKLDSNGKCTISVNCPQPYKDKGVSYMSHIHILVSNKKIDKWKKNIHTQNVLCKIDKPSLITHMKSKDRIIINALPAEYFEKAKIPNSFNLDYKKAKIMSQNQIHNKIKSMIKEHKNIQNIIKKNNLKLIEVPIIVYCYDNKCDAGHELANELFKAGYTNVIDYTDGILGYMGRTRYD